MDRWCSPAHDIVSVFKDPTLEELVGSKGFEPKRSPRGKRGYSPPADHPLVPPIWRQRQDSNPDPRALEARMLLLHHAAGDPHVATVLKTQPPSDLARASSGLEAKTKKAF
jgi:hypothetical protein